MECNYHCNCSYCYRIAQVLRASTIIVNHFTTEQQLKTHKNDKSLLISVENNFQTNYINNKKSGVIFVSTQPTNFKADEQKISLSLSVSHLLKTLNVLRCIWVLFFPKTLFIVFVVFLVRLSLGYLQAFIPPISTSNDKMNSTL